LTKEAIYGADETGPCEQSPLERTKITAFHQV